MPDADPKPRRPSAGRYDDLKPAVREAYETTDASIRSLAETFGIATETTIRKWRDAGNWRKDVGAIRARLVTRAMAVGADPDAHVAITIDAVTSRPRRPQPEPDDGEDQHQEEDDAGEISAPAPHAAPSVAAAIRPASEPPKPLASGRPPDPPGVTRKEDGTPVLDGKEWPWGFGVHWPVTMAIPEPDKKAAAGAAKPGPGGSPAARRAAKKAEKIAPPPLEKAGAHPGVDDEFDPYLADTTGDGYSARAIVRDGAHPAGGSVRTVRTREAPHPSVTRPYDRREEEAALDVATAKGLAEIHAAAIRRHTHMADRLLDAATSIIALTQVAMMPLPPDATEADIECQQRAIQRLTAVNGDKETLAGLLRAAAAVAQSAVMIQRKSLGMEDTQASEAIGSRPVESAKAPAVLAQLPLNVLSELREYAMRKTRERPTRALGAATEIRKRHEAGGAGDTPPADDAPDDDEHTDAG